MASALILLGRGMLLGPLVLSLSKDGRSPLVCKFKTNFVGDSPTANHFFLLRQEKVTKKKAPLL